MSSENNSTVVFLLGQSYLVTTEHLIVLTETYPGFFQTDFIIELRVSKILGRTLNVFGNSADNTKNHRLCLPKPLNGVSDRINV